MNPEDVDAYYNRGLAYGKKGLDDEAIKDLTKVIELDPQNVDAYAARGGAYYGKGNDEKAKEDWKRGADLGSDLAREALKEFLNIDY